MKISLPTTTFLIKLLIFLIIISVLFILTAFLYSVRYWPDLYNYVNANITIKRIPTISELNITVIDVIELNTESSTTDFDFQDVSTVFDTNTEDYFEDFNLTRFKRALDEEQDYSELPKKDVSVDYVAYDDQSDKVMKDLIDETKLKAKGLKDVEIMNVSTELPDQTIHTCNGDSKSLPNAVFPWVAAIFVKNDSKTSQFEYYCDGALISKTVVLTAARCVFNGNVTHKSEDFIVFLGKTSLQESGDQESIQKVKSVDVHPGFTIGETKDDLAMLILENPVTLTDNIQVACLRRDGGDDENGEAVTTAWGLSGNLTLIYFDKEKNTACGLDNKVENTFCATYGNDVPLCPSYGGIYVSETLNNSLYLTGTRSGDPADRGLCFSRHVAYTSLSGYMNWITKYIDGN